MVYADFSLARRELARVSSNTRDKLWSFIHARRELRPRVGISADMQSLLALLLLYFYSEYLDIIRHTFFMVIFIRDSTVKHSAKCHSPQYNMIHNT